MQLTKHDPVETPEAQSETEPGPRRPYVRPQVILELELETRAGSPLGIPDPLNPFGLEPKK